LVSANISPRASAETKMKTSRVPGARDDPEPMNENKQHLSDAKGLAVFGAVAAGFLMLTFLPGMGFRDATKTRIRWITVPIVICSAGRGCDVASWRAAVAEPRDPQIGLSPLT